MREHTRAYLRPNPSATDHGESRIVNLHNNTVEADGGSLTDYEMGLDDVERHLGAGVQA